jgi:hypothetical protein
MGDIGLDLADPRWATLLGGYKVPYDPRPALADLAEGRNVDGAWNDLWEGLHHQGDIGAASFAAIPHLVSIFERRGAGDWNLYALAATVEFARDNPTNPAPPPDVAMGYAEAWRRLAELGRRQLGEAEEATLVRGILAVLAIARGERMLGWFAIALTEEEQKELLAQSGMGPF